MVLGVLSVMVIMAVAFAIAMRTERIAAGNYADSVRARQLVQAGLARAMSDLALKLGTNGLGSAAAGTNYPPWAVTNSYTVAYTNTSTNLLYLIFAPNSPARENDATNFVPRALWAAATNADQSGASNHWLPIESLIYPFSSPPAVSNRMGRVKYLVLNCSGLLDANFAGGAPRNIGADPVEIAISNMAEMANPGQFINNRAADYRYETQAELAARNLVAFHAAPSNFTVYSRALPGYWNANWNCAATQVNLTGSPADLIDRHDLITNAFVNAGFSPLQAGILFSNLIDYVDGDAIPSNWTTCVESVPMINEITMSCIPSGAIVDNQVRVELWYPFVRPCGVFQFRAEWSTLDQYGVSNVYYDVATNQAGFQPNEFRTLLFSHSDSVSNAPFVFSLHALEVQDENGFAIDRIEVLPPGITVDQNEAFSAFCIDPRFNADMNDAAYWTPLAPNPDYLLTMGFINTVSSNAWGMVGRDNDWRMYVADQPLQSAGELGCLAYDIWQTVKLYGTNCQDVLDVFALGATNAGAYVTNTTWRGRVNPNTREPEVLKAALYDMPVDDYPGASAASRWDGASIQTIRTNIQAAYYTNLAYIGRLLDAADLPGDNELQKESFFRNAFNLFNLRQNLFTIIIEAQVASGGNIPRNPVRQRAVALVWRDPYTGEMFVRSIKWLQ